jgi:hypothetical protein
VESIYILKSVWTSIPPVIDKTEAAIRYELMACFLGSGISCKRSVVKYVTTKICCIFFVLKCETRHVKDRLVIDSDKRQGDYVNQ